ncbi:hypothetical protein D3C85_1603810 [compost metagenome]
MMMTNVVGCTLGSAANGTLLNAAIAPSMAINRISSALNFRLSNRMKKGNIASTIIIILNGKYKLSHQSTAANSSIAAQILPK